MAMTTSFALPRSIALLIAIRARSTRATATVSQRDTAKSNHSTRAALTAYGMAMTTSFALPRSIALLIAILARIMRATATVSQRDTAKLPIPGLLSLNSISCQILLVALAAMQ